MQRVLFIVHEYYPLGSAITNCLQPLIKQFQNENVSIDVLTRRQNKNLLKKEIIDGVTVYRINDKFNIINYEIERLINSKSNKLKIFVYKICRKILWIKYAKIDKRNDGFFDSKKFIKFGKKLSKIKGYDAVLSCSYPFESHKIAYNICKHNDLIWIACQFDPHSNNSTKVFSNDLYEKRLEEEIHILSNARRIFLPEDTYIANLNTGLKVLKSKYFCLQYPLIKKPKYEINSELNNDIIHFVFAGTLYEDIRNPFPMLDCFINSNLKYCIELYYFAEENIQKTLEEYKKTMGNSLILHRNATKNECNSALSNANIILNIGNTIINQTPSKVYELISIGKPIINFYTVEKDTSMRILKNYPLKLNVLISKPNMKELADFVNNNKNCVLPFEIATKKYKLSEEVAKEFVEEVGKCCNE